jgi:transketolase
MALAERLLAAEFGDDLVDHRTYVLASDGDLMEGISQEALALAGHLKLNRLIVLFDDNGISIDGKLSLSDSTDQVARFKASGWNAERIDGHDPDAIEPQFRRAEVRPPDPDRVQNTYRLRRTDQGRHRRRAWLAARRKELEGARKPPELELRPVRNPAEILEALAQGRAPQRRGPRGMEARRKPAEEGEFERRLHGELPNALGEAIEALKEKLPSPRSRRSRPARLPKHARRDLRGDARNVGGSADLTGSNNTQAPRLKAVSAGDFAGRLSIGASANTAWRRR